LSFIALPDVFAGPQEQTGCVVDYPENGVASSFIAVQDIFFGPPEVIQCEITIDCSDESLLSEYPGCISINIATLGKFTAPPITKETTVTTTVGGGGIGGGVTYFGREKEKRKPTVIIKKVSYDKYKKIDIKVISIQEV
jgi:hypothetical protein